MKVYRYEKDSTGRNGKMFGEVSEKNCRYFAKTFEGALMWAEFFNNLYSEKNIFEGYISEYEIEGIYQQRQINTSEKDCYTEIKIDSQSETTCILKKRVYVVFADKMAIDEANIKYEIPRFFEEYETKNREWKCEYTKNF